MRKALVIVGILLVVLAAAGAGGLYYAGSRAEERFDAAVERFSVPPAAVVRKVRYERGLFGAEAESAIDLAAGPMTFTVPLKHSISYLPLLTASAFAEVRTEVVPPPSIKPVVDKLLGGASPLSGITMIHFDGSEVTQFQSPAFDLDDAAMGSVSWKGISGTVTQQGSHLVIQVTAPGLKAENPALNVELQNLGIDADLTQSGDGLWFGKNRAQVGALRVGGALAPAFSGEGMSIKSETGEQAAGLLRSMVALDVKRMEVEEKIFTQMGFELHAGNLDRALFAKLKKVAEGIKPGAAGEAEASAIVFGSLSQFLRSSPTLNVRRFSAVTPWGDFKSDFKVAFDGKGELPEEMMMLVSRLTVDARVEMSAPFLHWLLQEQIRNGLQEASSGENALLPDEAQKLTVDLAATRLTRLEQAGALVPEGERYTLSLQMADGVIRVNGRPVNEVAALME